MEKNMSIAEKIFIEYVQSKEYTALYNEKRQKEEEAFCNKIEGLPNLSPKQQSQIEDICREQLYDSESFGFQNGFKIAMQIMLDCVPEKMKAVVA